MPDGSRAGRVLRVGGSAYSGAAGGGGAMNFRALHVPGHPLLLPNAWDFASAAVLAQQGFTAIGTTSLGVAAAAGLPDAAGLARAETLALAERLTRLDCLISIDIEGGFSEEPAAVADLAEQLARFGVAGVNVEDGRGGGGSLAPREHL